VTAPPQLAKSLKMGAGCDACRKSGYSGRVLLFEFAAMTPTLRNMILNKAPIEQLRAAAYKDGMEPMLVDGLRKCSEGVTSLAEVFRVVDAAD
jgi:general secretion pathway protein E